MDLEMVQMKLIIQIGQIKIGSRADFTFHSQNIEIRKILISEF